MAVKVIRKFRLLFDIVWGSPNNGDIPTYNAGTDKLVMAPPAAAAALAAHLADPTDAHDASAVSVVPFGSIAATDVQAALVEILAEAGGAGLPAWWTVVNTPGSESVTFDGVVRVESTITISDTDGFMLDDAGSFFEVYTRDSLGIRAATLELLSDSNGSLILRSDSDAGNQAMIELSKGTGASGFVRFLDAADSSVFEIDPTGAVTIKPSGYPSLGGAVEVLGTGQVTIGGTDGGAASLQVGALVGQTAPPVEVYGEDFNDLLLRVGVTGAVTISPSDENVIPLQVSSVDLKNGSYQYAGFSSDGEWTAQIFLNGLYLKALTGEGRSSISMSSRDSIESLELNSGGGGANQPYIRAYDGAEVFVVDDEGSVTIAPSAGDVALLVQDAGTTILSVGENVTGATVPIGAYLHGGFQVDMETDEHFQVRGPGPNQHFKIEASGEIGFFGVTPTAQPVEPATINEIVAAMQTLGLTA